jgi:hypothetical protein
VTLASNRQGDIPFLLIIQALYHLSRTPAIFCFIFQLQSHIFFFSAQGQPQTIVLLFMPSSI